jgi:hypothetical protein
MKTKSVLNDDIIVDIDDEQPINVSITRGLTPPRSPSSNFFNIKCKPNFFSKFYKEGKKIELQEEMDSIQRNDTWKLTKLPHDKKKIGTKWVYKTKLNSDGSVERHKARLVTKGFTHRSMELIMKRHLHQYQDKRPLEC